MSAFGENSALAADIALPSSALAPQLRVLWLAQLDAIDQRRGRAMRAEVSDFQARYSEPEWSLSALVQGSRSKPYETALLASFLDGHWQLQSSCTCPMLRRCKHVAAMLHFDPEAPIADALPDGGADSDPSAAQGILQRWMQELRAAAPEALDARAVAHQTEQDDGEVRLYLQFGIEVQGNFALAHVRPLLAALEQQRLHIQSELSPFRILPEHAKLLTGQDLAALKELAEFEPVLINTRHVYPLAGARGLACLEDAIRWRRLVATGRMGEPIERAAPGHLQLDWQANEAGRQRLVPIAFDSEERVLKHAVILNTEPLSAFDSEQNRWFRVRVPLSQPRLQAALGFGSLLPQKQHEQLASLRAQFGAAIPQPRSFRPREVHAKLTPVLRLSLTADREALLQRRLKRRIGFARQYVELALPPAMLDPLNPGNSNEVVPLTQYLRGLERVRGEELLQYAVDVPLVQRWGQDCASLGLERSAARPVSAVQEPADWLINADYDEQTLSEFCFLGVPELKRRGWRIEYSQGFPLKLIEQPLEFFADVSEQEGGRYFDLALGVEINGQKLSLLPIIESGLAQGRYDKLPDNPDAIVALHLPEGPVPITVSRLRLILALYQELGTSTRLPRMRAGVINELDAELGSELRWHGEANLRPLAERLETSLSDEGLPLVESPDQLQANLRPYQLFGLRWLKFLSLAELAGILADDMGLGKTVQVIAHILREKQDAAPDAPIKPVLVVAPTSVLPNWRAEVQRFAPNLQVLSLSGNKRLQRIGEIPSVDIVLTSYALLGRDLAKLLPHEFHLLVLDEAQLVKNPNTIAAKAARQIRARHRLCMTGTPLENHLGELWAQFDFLMPGFLGSKLAFHKHTRLPIEKRRDTEAAARLRARIAPFLLRRTKDQVVAELPPKSVIVKRIELEGKQRDAYETLRVKVKAQVQAQLKERGADRSRVSLLDALLKLRQVCCDARLLPTELMQAVPSAKLEHLMEMLQALVHEGRRILLFSQFTSMLALIEAELHKRKLKYLILTGASDDRETPVRRFQNREVPIFLISLRAGGVGLNLTAADTVIHYDPWWNPAVEEQATDRAYRIGQDKPVFVYRLIAADTVEERIEELKHRKRELADAVFEDGVISSFSADELLNLLE